MTETITATKSEFESIPTGEYLAELIDYENTDGQFGPQYKLIWEIVKPEKFAGKQRYDWCSKKLTTGGKMQSKLWGRIEALMNRPIQIGENIDLDALISRRAILVIVEEAKGDDVFAKIASVKPYKKQEPFVVGEFSVGEESPTDKDDPFDEE